MCHFYTLALSYRRVLAWFEQHRGYELLLERAVPRLTMPASSVPRARRRTRSRSGSDAGAFAAWMAARALNTDGAQRTGGASRWMFQVSAVFQTSPVNPLRFSMSVSDGAMDDDSSGADGAHEPVAALVAAGAADDEGPLTAVASPGHAQTVSAGVGGLNSSASSSSTSRGAAWTASLLADAVAGGALPCFTLRQYFRYGRIPEGLR